MLSRNIKSIKDMTYILCLETSAQSCSVALAHKDVCVASVTCHMSCEHARLLPQLCTHVLQSVNLDTKVLDAIALSEGPGSFTGLRIGSAIAKGMCIAADLPLISCDTLYILVKTWYNIILQPMDFFLALVPMKNHTFAYRLYDQYLRPLTTLHVGALQPKVLSAHLQAGTLCVLGASSKESWGTYFAHMKLSYVPHAQLRAEHMCAYAYQKYVNKDFVSVYDFSPVYGKEAVSTTKL